jgi:hypothetical protein
MVFSGTSAAAACNYRTRSSKDGWMVGCTDGHPYTLRYRQGSVQS